MALFQKKGKRVIEVGGQRIELQPKPSKNIFSSILSLFKKKRPAPIGTAPTPPIQVITPGGTQPFFKQAPAPIVPKEAVQAPPPQPSSKRPVFGAPTPPRPAPIAPSAPQAQQAPQRQARMSREEMEDRVRQLEVEVNLLKKQRPQGEGPRPPAQTGGMNEAELLNLARDLESQLNQLRAAQSKQQPVYNAPVYYTPGQQQPQQQPQVPTQIPVSRPEEKTEAPQPQRKGILGFAQKPKTAPQVQMPQIEVIPTEKAKPTAPAGAPKPAAVAKPPPKFLKGFIEKTAEKNKASEAALRESGAKTSFQSFIMRMLFASILLGIAVAVTVFLVLSTIGLSFIESVIVAAVLAIAIYQGLFRAFMQYPTTRGKTTAKNIERDILFAARDLIISLRSGMPLFNAITAISRGYGDASKEFEKVVDKVQLGMPLEDAIDDTIAKSKSPSFKRLMLQASVSIKAGADVVSALQSIIDQLSQERVIELRAYGQKLNAIAMFYMLFGVILPSMGIAVITILTTFIAIFTVDNTILEFVLVGIVFLQLIFLRMIMASRPVFAM